MDRPSLAGSTRARRGAPCARVRGQRGLDVGCALAHGRIARTVRSFQAGSPLEPLEILEIRLVAVPGWFFVVLDEPTA